MRKPDLFAYSLRGRIIWISDKLFQIPVIHDLYRIHKIEDSLNMNQDNCTEYVIEFFHKFIQQKPIHRPVQDFEKEEVKLAHEKIKSYVKLSDYVNYAYSSSLPIIFSEEADKTQILAKSLIDCSDLNTPESDKHNHFVHQLITDKKVELQIRYLELMNEIKKAPDLETLQVVSYKIVFEGINVV